MLPYTKPEEPTLNSPNDYRMRLHTLYKELQHKRPKLTPGQRYGNLIAPGHRLMKRVHGRQHFLCQCECGQQVYLEVIELLAREELQAGCALPDCTHTKLEAKRWLNIDFSLQQQWAFYVYTNPFDVANEWGGSLFRDRRVKDERRSRGSFVSAAKKMVDTVRGTKIWIKKIEPALPLMPNNIVATEYRPKDMFITPWNYISDGFEFHTHSDVAVHFGVSPVEVIAVRGRHDFSFDAFSELVTLTS